LPLLIDFVGQAILGIDKLNNDLTYS
jgi:hypothetical protein